MIRFFYIDIIHIRGGGFMRYKMIIAIVIITGLLLGFNYFTQDVYVDGHVKSIMQDGDKYILTIETTNSGERIQGYIDKDTFIGDATKSPSRPISFIKPGMGGGFVFKKIIGMNYIKSMNLYF